MNIKTKLALALLITAITLFACKHKHTCEDVVKPSNLQPIDWNGWNDAYTVGYTFYDNVENACYDFNGDTILCYGHIAKILYENHTSLKPEHIFFEGSENMKYQEWVYICFSSTILQNNSERDSLISILNNYNHSDTCFVKGILNVEPQYIDPCDIVLPHIYISKLEDIYFK